MRALVPDVPRDSACLPDASVLAPTELRTVLVVDDHPVFRRGLVGLLRGEPWVREVLQAADAQTAVRLAVTSSVDVVSMDLRLPSGQTRSDTPEGLCATRDVLRARPSAAVLVLTMIMDDALVAAALAAGARGYLLKSADPDEVVEALRLVARGGTVLGTGVGPAALVQRSKAEVLSAPFNSLTERELNLARLVASGRTNPVIARTLGISEKTVRNQLSSLLVRLGVPDRVAMALLARDGGLGDLPL